MRKLYCAFGLTLAAVAFWPSWSFAQTTGPATRYDVQVQQVELCTGNGGGNGCDNPFVVGTGNKTFDIASASVGAQVGSYASTAGIPVGVTYSHVRVTLSRTFTIVGTVTGVTGVGGTGNCRTGGTDATGFTATTGGTGLNTAGTATAQLLNVPNANAFGAGIPTFPSSFKVTDNDPIMTMTIALTAPFTAALNQPTINVSFNTQTAVGASNDGTGGCRMFPQPPSVSITVQ